MDHNHSHHATSPAQTSKLAQYRPLILVLLGILAATFLAQLFTQNFSGQSFMRLFMGFFFLVFGAFKLLDLRGFADAYAEYDLIAQRSRAYALAYPFIELALGLAFLFAWQLTLASYATIVVLGIGSIGVLLALLDKRRIRCACLGAVIKLPMTTVTLIEDLGMVAMAVLMLTT